MKIDLLGSLPAKEAAAFNPHDPDDFFDRAYQNPGTWWPIQGHAKRIVADAWESFFKHHNLLQEELRILDLGGAVLIIQINSAAYLANESSKEYNIQNVHFRHDRKMPDWRQVTTPVTVRAPSAGAIRNSIHRNRKRFGDAVPTLYVSEPLSKPDAEGLYSFQVSRKNASLLNTRNIYQRCYQQIRRLKSKNQPIPAELLFETQKCDPAEREALRPYFQIWQKLRDAGKLRGGELTEWAEWPLDTAREFRDGLSVRGTWVESFEQDYGIDPASLGVPLASPPPKPSFVPTPAPAGFQGPLVRAPLVQPDHTRATINGFMERLPCILQDTTMVPEFLQEMSDFLDTLAHPLPLEEASDLSAVMHQCRQFLPEEVATTASERETTTDSRVAAW